MKPNPKSPTLSKHLSSPEHVLIVQQPLPLFRDTVPDRVFSRAEESGSLAPDSSARSEEANHATP